MLILALFCLLFSQFMRRLRLQYDYGNYSTYDYDHITLRYSIHTIHSILLYDTCNYITGRPKYDSLTITAYFFTELYTTYVKVFTGRFHIRYSFNCDTEYKCIIGLRYIIIHTFHIILYSIQEVFIDQEERQRRNEENRKGNKEEIEKGQIKKRKKETGRKRRIGTQKQRQKMGRKFV